MSDISSFWNIDEMQADWQENFGILTSDNDMHTAVLISLFTDGLARADDPYEGTDRRGWWGDLGNEKTIGSRLWLLRREKLTRDVATGVLPDITEDVTGGGSLGNADAGTILTLDANVSGIESTVTLIQPATGGADIEDEEDFRQRGLLLFQNPPQGGSDTDYRTWALAVSGVTRAWVRRRGMGPGTVVIYIMCDGNDKTNHGFPVGTDGVSQLEEWGAVKATGDQGRVADYMYPLAPVTSLNYICSPVMTPTY